MGRRLPPWRQSREPRSLTTVGPETVVARSVIVFIVDSRVAERVLREQSDRPSCRRRAIPLPRRRSSGRPAAHDCSGDDAAVRRRRGARDISCAPAALPDPGWADDERLGQMMCFECSRPCGAPAVGG
jgi:hypothetical protein